MVKKFIVVVVCIVAVCAVLGLPDRLTYDGMKTAVESIQSSTEVIAEDALYLEIFSTVLDTYDPMAEITIAVEHIQGQWQLVYTKEITYPDDRPEGYPTAQLGVKYFPLGSTLRAYEFGQEIVSVARPLTWGIGNANGVFDTAVAALNGLLFFVGALVSLLLFAAAIIFDVVGVAWAVVKAAFYLLGLSTTL